MEEVWKDITLGAAAGPNTASCMDHHIHHHINYRQPLYQPHSTTLGAPPLTAQWHTNNYQYCEPPPPPGVMTLQDFLAAGVNAAARQDASGAAAGTPAAAAISSYHHPVSAMAVDAIVPGNGVITGIHSVSPMPAGPLVVAPPTTTGLSLSSSFDLNVYYSLDDPSQSAAATTLTAALAIDHMEPAAAAANGSAPVGNPRSDSAAVSSPFPTPSPFMDAIGSPGTNGLIFPFGGGNKWSAAQRQQQLLGGADASDNRQRRRIKNRVSAARSRARKQAYTNELEAEVAHLTEENIKLRAQNEEMRLALAAQLPARKKALQRSSTAPF